MIDFSSYFPITDSTWIFFIVLLIILFAPMIMSKLRIPHIIGMVLAGVIVGQYGLNILQRDGSDRLAYTISCSWQDWRWIWKVSKNT